MKFCTITIAILALAAAALAGGGKVSTSTLTGSKNVLMPGHGWNHGQVGSNINGHGARPGEDGGHGCNPVPEPLTMLVLIPGAAMLIRRRKA